MHRFYIRLHLALVANSAAWRTATIRSPKTVVRRIPVPVLESQQLLSLGDPEAVSVHEDGHQFIEPMVLLWSVIKEVQAVIGVLRSVL